MTTADTAQDAQIAPTDTDMEAQIREFFELNFEALRLEGGHSFSPNVKEIALQQVLLYWHKLHDIAVHVTDTEVRLNLPGQTTPGGRTFGIEGVVDIVRENDRTTMYDIKTHDAEAVRGNTAAYEKQLNVYAHIWKNLRGQELDETAIIATELPPTLREALASGNTDRVEAEVAKWRPVIEIPYDPRHVASTIADFGRIVDAIEDADFAPPSYAVLTSRLPGARRIFAINVCLECDARYSCAAFRNYAVHGRAPADRTFRAYYGSSESDIERDNRLFAALDAMPSPDDLDLES